MFWPERSEFVRMCATLNATIVPFSAIGCADSFRMVLDSQVHMLREIDRPSCAAKPILTC